MQYIIQGKNKAGEFIYLIYLENAKTLKAVPL